MTLSGMISIPLAIVCTLLSFSVILQGNRPLPLISCGSRMLLTELGIFLMFLGHPVVIIFGKHPFRVIAETVVPKRQRAYITECE